MYKHSRDEPEAGAPANPGSIVNYISMGDEVNVYI